MKKVGQILEFLYDIYWWTWKTNKKTVEVGQEKQNDFNIYNVEFFKKNKAKDM